MYATRSVKQQQKSTKFSTHNLQMKPFFIVKALLYIYIYIISIYAYPLPTLFLFAWDELKRSKLN